MNNAAKCVIFKFVQALSLLSCIIPQKKNRVVFMSHRGASQYADSPKYISEYLQKNYPGKYEIVWIVSDLAKFEFLRKNNIKIIQYRCLAEILNLNTAKVVITNSRFGPYLIKRKGQLRINTLHGGGAYKTNTLERDKYAIKYQELRTSVYNLMISSCRLSTEYNIREDFRYKGDILECGMPRNDLFFKDNKDVLKKVRMYFNLSTNDKLLLYAPTWRDNDDDLNIRIDFNKLNQALSKRFGGTWKILLRTHHLSHIDISQIVRKDPQVVLDARTYSDVQELLCSADMLVTDYSSLLWDFALRELPILLYVPDLAEYTAMHGFNVPVEEWGLFYAVNESDIYEIILNQTEEQFKNAARQHLKKFGSYETGCATKTVCNKINKFVFGGDRK